MPTLHEFVTRTEWSDLSHEARHEAKRCLLDLIGVAAAGTTTRQVVSNFVAPRASDPSRTTRGTAASPSSVATMSLPTLA